MQKFSLLTIACCLAFMFTACKKETLLETNSKNPTSTNISSQKSNDQISQQLADEELVNSYELDAADAAAITSYFLKQSKSGNGASSECHNNTPNTNQCGSSFSYSSCQFGLEIWNDPTNLYLDFDFSSQLVGTRRDCNGRTCNYWLVPYLQLNLYNASGTKIGVLNLSTANITSTSKTFTINVASLASYGSVACVSVSGYFKALKQCSGGCGGNSSIQCVGTYCLSGNACQRFCLQICQGACPTVTDLKVDKTKLCGGGAIKAFAVIAGDASKASTVWTLDGQTYTGNTVDFDLPLNSTCAPITKTITGKVICTTDQSVLAERTFTVEVNPALTATVSVDNFSCNASINLSCPADNDNVDINWTINGESGTGKDIQVGSVAGTLNYTISRLGCTYTGSQDNVFCMPFLKNNTTKSDR
ncbi:MAG: hypothetical protein U0U67_15215 [Chitinophagales bacterium]